MPPTELSVGLDDEHGPRLEFRLRDKRPTFEPQEPPTVSPSIEATAGRVLSTLEVTTSWLRDAWDPASYDLLLSLQLDQVRATVRAANPYIVDEHALVSHNSSAHEGFQSSQDSQSQGNSQLVSKAVVYDSHRHL